MAGHENIKKIVLHFTTGAGFYYTIDGNVQVNEEFLQKVETYMQQMVEKKIPVMKRSISTSAAIDLFHRYGMYDKEKLFKYRRVSRVNIYSLEEFEDYFYGYMVWHTGYLKYFKLYPYDEGWQSSCRPQRSFRCRRNLKNGEKCWMFQWWEKSMRKFPGER